MSTVQPVPSRMMLQAFKARKKGAQQGHSLLKKKSDALSNRFRGMLREIVDTKQEMGAELRDAAFAQAKVTYAVDAGSNYQSQLAQAVKKPAVTLKIATENVAGVRLPVFEMDIDPTADVLGNMGIARGHQVLQAARDRFIRALQLLVRLASMQTSFFTLDAEIKMTNRRVNALENVVIPTLEDSISYIDKELNEQEREEFFRLKKIQKKKKERQEAQMASKGSEFRDEAPSAIFEEKDQDIIF